MISALLHLALIVNSHYIALTWDAEPGAVKYHVIRGLSSGGPYPRIVCAPVKPKCDDHAVVSGTTYYYVVTATDSKGNTSKPSMEAKAVAK